MMRAAQLGVACVAVLVATAGQVQGGIIILSDPASFSGSETLLTFEGAGTNNGDDVSTFGGVSFLLSSGDPAQFRVDAFTREFGPQDSSSIDNIFGQTVPYPDMTLDFTGQINRVGFEMRTNAQDDIGVSLFSGGSFVGSTAFSTKGGGSFYFYGLESSTSFDRLVIDVDEIQNGAFALDNLRFESTVNPVPEPSSLAIFGIGACVVGFGVNRRRRRESATKAAE